MNSFKRNKLSVSKLERFIYVHYNLLLLYHYCIEVRWINHMTRDNYPEDNLDDGALALGNMDISPFDDHNDEEK